LLYVKIDGRLAHGGHKITSWFSICADPLSFRSLGKFHRKELTVVNKHKLGLVFGSFLALWHFTWALLVLTGMAQSLMDWIFRLHFIQPPYTILAFNFGAAVALIMIVTVTGYLSGWVLGAIWNWLRADTPREYISVVRRQPVVGR
jgi:hypothetical protein